jgi:uncharacterized protein (TIGR00269 family)
MEDNPFHSCSICTNQAIYLDRTTESHLCSHHLKRRVEEQVIEKILHSGNLPDTLGIAFSGGKDSTALLAAVVKLKNQIPSKLVALTIDEGIRGYREDTIRHAEEVCRKLGVEHRIISFKELYGKNLDELMQKPTSKACTICGILRRRALEILAEQLGIHLIATGHNLDDHAQTSLMNALSADIKKVFSSSGKGERYAKRIKPFALISEREASLYAILENLFKDLPECPYAKDSLRGEIRQLLYGFEQSFPGSMKNAALFEEGIKTKYSDKVAFTPLVTCPYCGWPGSGEICRVCLLLGKEWYQQKINERP